jgi:general secretion pathway protein I
MLSKVRGFTLVEVLVALGIASVALIAALRAAGNMTGAADELNTRSLALWSAENRLVEIRVQRQWPDVGKRSTECPQGTMKLVCSEEVFATPNPFFRRVEVEVFLDGTPRSVAKLTGFAVQN